MPASLNVTPLSPVAAPTPHTSPATAQPVVPGALGWRHKPSVAPVALLQRPPQHSPSLAQALPVCVQNEPSVQLPLRQSFEQHSLCAVHELPVVLQAGLSGLQVWAPPSAPAAQLPPQHWAEVVQAWLSDVHGVDPHFPPVQTNVQQS
jgi:hypothetical protein